MAPSTTPRKWRLEPQKRKAGTYYVLGSGSRETKQTVSLGYVTHVEAERALQRMNEEEHRTVGTPAYGRLLRLRDAQGMEAVVSLLTDPADDYLTDLDLPPDYGRMPLREYVETVYGPHRAAAKPRTWRTEENQWKLVHDYIGDVALDDVDEHVMVDFLDHRLRRRDGGPASPNMRRLCQAAVSACITYACRRKHRTNPRPTWFRIEGTGKRANVKAKTLTAAEVLALIEHAPGHVEMTSGRSWAHHRDKYRSLFACLFGLGLRPSEAAKMRWEDVSWDDGTVYVSGGDDGQTKTEASRAVIALLPLARKHLRTWWETRGCPSTGIVHVAPGNKFYVTDRSGGFSGALKEAAKAAGITKSVTPYWGRHTYASLAIEAGTTVQTVAKTLRHTSPQMVQRRYDHSAATRAPDLDRAAGIYGDIEE